ncbi:MAG: SBBP repeat-containing protein [Thermodesulfobacteriota bacterium]
MDKIGNVYVTASAPTGIWGVFSSYTLKYAPSGNLVWKVEGGIWNRDIAIDETGNIYVVGTTINPNPFLIKYNPSNQPPLADADLDQNIYLSDSEFSVSGEVTISVSSPLTIDVTQAKVDFGKKGKVEGKVNLKADFVYTGIPGPYDLIVVTFDGVTLVEEPFGSFDEDDDDPGEYKYKEKNIHVKIDFIKGTIKVSGHKMVLAGIDNSNGIDMVISFGDSTGTDHFVMKEKKKDDEDKDEKKLSYKNKKNDDN